MVYNPALVLFIAKILLPCISIFNSESAQYPSPDGTYYIHIIHYQSNQLLQLMHCIFYRRKRCRVIARKMYSSFEYI
jgi:hypothetical protein